jgi:hypothetical protein
LFFLLVPAITGCSCGVGVDEPDETEDPTSSSTGDPLPCGIDCSALPTPDCKVAVCNTGQEIGPLNTCVVVAASKGSSCDDGVFCTSEDTCDGAGTCAGGAQNECGLDLEPCEAVICYEATKSCSVTPASDGTSCTPEDLCESNGVCETGTCIGEPKDCTFSPLAECNDVECDPATGQCVGTPDEFKDNLPCVLTGELCNDNKSCQAGECVGGTPKDCSGLDFECVLGECDTDTGICQPTSGPLVLGLPCTDGVTECQVGKCNVNGSCDASNAADGSSCNDHQACTSGDECVAGACADSNAVSNCSVYLQEGFESCPSGWAFAGDWECGVPSNVGPSAAHAGNGVIATQIDALYSVNQAWATTTADSPAIDLAGAVAPKLAFWAWDKTEGGTFDGWNLSVSTNGGTSFTPVTTVTPAYPLTISGQQAWGGDHSAEGWQAYSADLTAYAGQSIILRFAFRSDGASVFPGVYIDDVVVAEPLQDPLYITTDSPLPSIYSGMAATIPITRVGGSAAAVWSIVGAGVNSNWLTIDPVTGVLTGTPTVANAGAVSLTVRVQEPGLPSNYDQKTLAFTVVADVYYTSFEGACPDGWTLTGDWECGVPTNVGPATAYVGTQCIATKIASNYTTSEAFATTTATSPDIDLTASPSPVLTFRMWLDTEGATYDGVNFKVSNDGGATFNVVNTVDPPYTLTIASQPAWGGHQAGLGWQPVQVDLSAFAGQVIKVQFGFRSDSSNTFPGVYIDDVFVN